MRKAVSLRAAGLRVAKGEKLWLSNYSDYGSKEEDGMIKEGRSALLLALARDHVLRFIWGVSSNALRRTFLSGVTHISLTCFVLLFGCRCHFCYRNECGRLTICSPWKKAVDKNSLVSAEVDSCKRE